MSEDPAKTKSSLEASGIWIVFLVIMLGLGVQQYGCELLREQKMRTDAYERCARADKLTPTCEVILKRP
jgi:hypothetical protein